MTTNKKSLTFLSLWAINGELDKNRLTEQLQEMKRLGMQGTIFHPRYYPGKPQYLGKKYLQILSETILKAKELNLEFWIYDENGWPSGSADGQVLKKFPESICEWLEYRNGTVVKESQLGFNTFYREQVAFFLEYTYEGYRKGLEPEAFEYVTGFFSDEVGFLDGHGASMTTGGIPWCPEAAERYELKYHQPLQTVWQMLFVEEEGYQEVRYRYWQLLADILSESFYQTIGSWCNKYKKRYTAHLKGEENLFFQTSYSGSLFQNLKHVNMPAIDALERFPGNHYFPRCVSSLSKQFWDGQCLTEAIGGSGWGLSPEDLVNYVDWLAECGITTIAFHLWQYEKNSASIRDWPPNIPCGLTWKESAAEIFAGLREKWHGKVITQNPILLIAPERGVMSEFVAKDVMLINEHNGDGTPESKSGNISSKFANFVEHCHEMGMLFDICSERILEEHGTIQNGSICVGKAQYSSVICGDGAVVQCDSLKKQAFAEGIWYDTKEWVWQYVGNGGNQMMLEAKETRIPCQGNQGSSNIPWNIRTQDLVKSVIVNGKELKGKKEKDYFAYEINNTIKDKCIHQGEISIQIIPLENGEQQVFAFLEGDILVKNKASYVEKDHRQWRAEGKFYLTNEDQEKIEAEDLVTSGFPFCGTYVELESNVFVDKEGKLSLDARFLHGDCAELILDRQSVGYLWGPSWKKAGLFPGIHKARIRLYPSTFNTYGPHHHLDGDRHLTSPMQYSGQKGFADHCSAPEFTLIPEWHFVKFGIV